MNLSRFIKLILVVTTLTMFFGCSSAERVNDNPVVSSAHPTDAEVHFHQQSSMGHFTLSLDAETVSAVIEPVDRESAIDVTNFVNINITGISWDPTRRIWDIDVEVHNPSPYTGYGPWVVLTETGQQHILDQDGFVWIPNPTRRVPVIAFAKENHERAFYAGTTEQFSLQIYWHPGWHGFAPLHFYIDAWFPGPRQQPIVEDLNIQPTMLPEGFIITAFAKDWQKEDGIQYVWADLRPIGGPQYLQMFDDGNHGDGEAGNDIYGNNFMAIIPDPPVALTVHAMDTEGYRFENDIWFGHFDEFPCQPMQTLARGFHSKIVTEKGMVARTEVEWIDLWNSHSDSPHDIPYVDFDTHMVVAVFMGEQGSTGFSVDIDCVRFIGAPMENMINVYYTKHIPDRETCITQPAMTQPYHIAKVLHYRGADNFIGADKIYYCD